MENIRQSRQLLWDLTKREFKIRYLGSVLGSYWNVVHPLVMILIYTLVFSRMMGNRLGGNSSAWSYSLYLCAGLLPWTFFQEIVLRSITALLDNAAFLKKLAFPPVILFGATLASAAINFLIAFAIFTVFLLIVKPVAPIFFLLYGIAVILFAATGLGLGMMFGSLFVFLRDVQQVVQIVFQLWFWFTPIVYLTTVLPEFAQKLLLYNPAFAFLESFHSLLYFETYPAPHLWGLMIFWAVLSLTLGALVYRRSISLVRDFI